ncbi:MAG: nicotinate (nicotinamide) nucleotide adenylyltransferase [Deltaproteobacteria bacterium]
MAVFGGSFDPPHVSHVLCAAYVLATQPVDALLVVPTYAHPFGKKMAAYEHRIAMCERAFADLRRVEVSDIEREIGGESKTLFTLRALQERHADWSLRFVVGSDILAEQNKWYAWDSVVALAPLIVLGRAGFPHPDAGPAVIPEAASRDVRSALASGEDVSTTVPARVLEYVREHGLYRAA